MNHRKPGKHGASSRSPNRQTSTNSRFGHWLRLLMVVIALTAATYWAMQQLLAHGHFPLRYVSVTSEPRYLNQDLIRELNRYYLGRNFFSINIKKVQNAVAEDPWIAEAKVRRIWPDGLEIQVLEREVFARWNEHELLDVYGERFFPITLPPAAEEESRTWPLINGPDGQEQNLLLSFQEANELLQGIDLNAVALQQNQRWAWSLALDNGITLQLGRKEFRQRLQRFISVYPGFLAAQDQEIASIDLRYRSGFAVRWVNTQNGSNPETIAHIKDKQIESTL